MQNFCMFYPGLIFSTPLCKVVIAYGQTRFIFEADKIVSKGAGPNKCVQEFVLKTVLHEY